MRNIILIFTLLFLISLGSTVVAADSETTDSLVSRGNMVVSSIPIDFEDNVVEKTVGKMDWEKFINELRNFFTASYSRIIGIPSSVMASMLAIGTIFISIGGLALLINRTKIPESEESRPMILYNVIREHPGITPSELEELAGHSRGSVSYNIHRLIKAGKIRKIARDATTHLYTASIPANEEEECMHKILAQKNQHKIFKTVAAMPGISQRELTETTGIPQTTLQWHLSKLLKYDAVQALRDKNTLHYTAVPDYVLLYNHSIEGANSKREQETMHHKKPEKTIHESQAAEQQT